MVEPNERRRRWLSDPEPIKGGDTAFPAQEDYSMVTVTAEFVYLDGRTRFVQVKDDLWPVLSIPDERDCVTPPYWVGGDKPRPSLFKPRRFQLDTQAGRPIYREVEGGNGDK